MRRSQNFYVYFFLVFMVFTTALFFTGGDLLLTIFALTLASIFFVLGAYKASSPYSFIGAERELILMMAYEPMVLLAAVGMYLVTRSFIVGDIARSPRLLVRTCRGCSSGSSSSSCSRCARAPSTSPRPTTPTRRSCEASPRSSRAAPWPSSRSRTGTRRPSCSAWWRCSSPPFPGWLPWPPRRCSFLMILVDNVFARVKWQLALASGWIVAATLGVGNIMVVYFLR